MRVYQKIGLHLNGMPDDESVLAFADRIATLAESAQIHCVYCVREDADDDEADLPDPLDTLREKLSPRNAERIQLHIAQGNGLREILAAARDYDLDMIIIGRPLPSSQAAVGHVAGRVARKAPCTVFVVPPGPRPHLGRVLVPVDFSEHSRLALFEGIKLASQSGEKNPQVVAHTVTSVGYGYSKLGLSFDEATSQCEENARKRLEKFVSDVETSGVKFELACTCSEEPDAAIREAATSRKMDLVCVGSRGATSDTVALLGSTTERLVSVLPCPVLVVKRKGETAKLLDVLLGRD